jgi:hypothetical protein
MTWRTSSRRSGFIEVMLGKLLNSVVSQAAGCGW